MKVRSDVFILPKKNYVWCCTFSVVNLCLDLFTIARSLLAECDDHDLLTDWKQLKFLYTWIFIWLCYI